MPPVAKRQTTLFYQLIVLSSVASSAWAYSFQFNSTPQQCANLSISITGSGGNPPYRALVIPFGQSPLPNNIEARRIVDQPFPGDSTSVSFQLKYPTNSQFVVVVSDANSFGSGGTSVAAIVTSSNDNSCFDPTTNVQPDFFYSIDPPNQVVQCQTSRLWWDPANVQGNLTFYGAIPGGQSFNIPVGSLSTVANEGVGFSWTPTLRAGTTIMLGAGDSRGIGAGGSVTYIVSAGLNPVSSCLNDQSPSSTPGSPAGGSYPTSTSGAGTGGGGSGGSKTNVGAIVGGVIGGVVGLAAIILLLLFFRRRRRIHARDSAMKERPDLIDVETPASHGELPPPDPFIVPPPPTEPSEAAGTENAQDRTEYSRRYSNLSSSSRPSTPLTSLSGGPTSTWAGASSRKSTAPPSSMRPVNIIQHDDAGTAPIGPSDSDTETIELPPAYTNIRRES